MKKQHRKPLRAAVVGAGLMGRWHAHAIEKCGGIVVAIADTNLDAARGLVKAHRGAQSFSDFSQMLGAARPDMVHICTPLETHQLMAETAIESGCHVLVEKPLTPEAGSTLRLLEHAAQRGVLLCPVHQFSFQDGALFALRRLHQLGRIVHLQATFCSAGGDGQSGGALDDVVADILPHPLSLFQTFLGGDLPAENWTTTRSGAGELRAFCTREALTMEIFISMNARPTQSLCTLIGTQGTIHLDLFHGFALAKNGRVSRRDKILQPFEHSLRHLGTASTNLIKRAARGEPAYPGLQRLVAAFYDAASGGGAAPISHQATLQTAQIRDALIAQAKLADTSSQAS